ncbi:MAG TPA: ion channel [Pirellulaceae bacterium]|jgi:hypothetical protein|nr:ion channel [Pirellulaceae bacterium]
MYAPYLALFGLLLVCIALADAVWTALGVRGAGWISWGATGWVRRIATKLPPPLAENASILAVSSSFFVWTSLLWIGWTLVFCGDAGAVVAAEDGTPASLVSRFYFAGFSLTTLGVGDLRPGRGVWEIASVIAAANGFVFLTLVVTYSYSIVTALNVRRAFGAGVVHLGSTPEEIALLLRDGGAAAVGMRLQQLTAQLETIALQSGAHPAIAFSRSRGRRSSFTGSVQILSDFSLLLEHAVAGEERLPAAVYEPLSRAIESLVDETGIESPEDPPLADVADLNRLRAAGLVIAADAEGKLRSSEVIKTRACVQRWLRRHGGG